MKRTIVLSLVVATVLVGCGGSSQSVPPAATSTQFTALVSQVMAAPADSAAPLELASLDIAYGDDENPQAFDDLLAAVM